ncbi:MAG: phytanoyl-CoA dioxygenase family protein [Sandaracinaceae bacterium]
MARGFLDGVSEGRVLGWAWDPASPSTRQRVALTIDGQPVADVTAEGVRPDLESAGVGDGGHAFDVPVPGRFFDGRRHRIDARVVGGDQLDGSPWQGRLGTASGPDQVPAFRSRYGGLWTDLSNAEELLDGRLALGRVTPEEGEPLRRFIRDGYVIFRGAVPPAELARLNASIASCTTGGDPRIWVESFGPNGTSYETLRPDHVQSRAKVLDLHAHLPAARDVAFSPVIAGFLEHVFERPLLAFQSLYLQRGVEQPLHVDTAYVKVSSPNELVAAWVALEPIRAGSGELELYAGSHALEEELFEGAKWMPPGHVAPDVWGDTLRGRCEQAELRYERFIARPGDVLLWAADLVHGGSRCADDTLTRRSFVVHYCPATLDPIYDGPAAPRFEHAPGHGYTYCLR